LVTEGVLERMSGPQDPTLPRPLCPSDLSGFKFLYDSQFQKYKQSATFFQQIQAFNSNISTLRFQGQTTLSYYQFPTNQQKDQYIRGRFLLTQSYPALSTLFLPVEQN
jgi:hypothetical protein